MKKTIVGQTASVGFQIGVRRTLQISPEQAWAFLTSTEGLKLWCGSVLLPTLNKGDTFISDEGITGQFGVVKPLSHIRMKWKKDGWNQASTLQIRLISEKPERTTISFHQENLDHLGTREEMKLYWEDVLTRIKETTSFSI